MIKLNADNHSKILSTMSSGWFAYITLNFQWIELNMYLKCVWRFGPTGRLLFFVWARQQQKFLAFFTNLSSDSFKIDLRKKIKLKVKIVKDLKVQKYWMYSSHEKILIFLLLSACYNYVICRPIEKPSGKHDISHTSHMSIFLISIFHTWPLF